MFIANDHYQWSLPNIVAHVHSPLLFHPTIAPVKAHKTLSGPMIKVKCEFDVPPAVRSFMCVPARVVTFTFFDPTDLLIRLLALSPLGAREENLAFFPEPGNLLHDYCHGDRLQRMYDTIPQGAAILSAVIFFDEINRDAKGFASGDGAIVVGSFFRQRVRESTYSKASIGTFPQVEFPKVWLTHHSPLSL
jgi:hypothetical protein